MRNRYLEAFKENFNVIGLTTAVAVSAAMLNPLPLLIGLVAEVAYLVFVPDSRWYEMRLSKLHDADVERRRQEIKDKVFPTLRPAMQARFLQLEELRHEMATRTPDEQTWFREVLRKLDFLLEKFLQFAAKEVQFRAYLEAARDEARRGGRGGSKRDTSRDDDARRDDARRNLRMIDDQRLRRGRQSAPPEPDFNQDAANTKDTAPRDPADRWVFETVRDVQAHYDQELAEVQSMLEGESDPSTMAVLEKRVEVLGRRREFVGKIGRITMNLNHQLQLLEDTFGLISDELLARPPEQVLADIEDVVSQTNTMTQVLEEVAPYEQMLQRLSA